MTEKQFTCHQMIADYSTGEDIDFDFLQELIDEQEQPKDLRMHISDGNKIITYRECVDLLNQLNNENEQLKAKNDGLEKDLQETMNIFKEFEKENEQLKSNYSEQSIQLDYLKDENKHMQEVLKENRQLKKQLHLLHMSAMFSTVKSFKGDISKRYKYSEETDRIYDTANHYGQYHKILNNKEIVMLLNEYNTFYEELSE